MNQPLSMFPETEWPAICSPFAAGVFATLFQLEHSQWQSPDELAQNQFRQLARVVRQAYESVPFYRQRFDRLRIDPATATVSREAWAAIPLLERRDVQLAARDLASTASPPTHGKITATSTSGSTNQPVTTLGTELTEFFWRVLTLRDHLWHRRDLSQSMAAIRYTGDDAALPPQGETAEDWGSATTGVYQTGKAQLLNIRSSIHEQADWLQRVNPGYLLSYPSTLRAIAETCPAIAGRLTNLREVRTFGEIVEPECREICERVFGVKLVDMYSSQEVGYIALQCPENENYHIQSESLFVEVIDESGRECVPGEIGKVLVSTLHNFAMPLLRYDIGDYAEVGGVCPCGRGLPVLKRILGRQRNLLVMPDGRKCWPVFNAGQRPEELPRFYQFQVVQRSREQLEILVVRHAELTEAEERSVVRYLRESLGHAFEMTIRRVDEIPRSPSGKFEDFISLAE